MSDADGPKRYLGFDLGGSKMLAVVYDEQLRPLARQRTKTKAHEGVASGLGRIVELIEKACGDAGIRPDRLTAVGIGCPGPIDMDKGVIRSAPNLPYDELAIGAKLTEALSCPVHVLNDVDAGVYGEYRFGAGRDAHSVLGVFPGTGIGGGFIYRGEVFRGAAISCMELGHIPVDDCGPPCGCGRNGCLEAVASRLALAAEAAKAAHRGDAPTVLKEAGMDLAKIRSGVLRDAAAAGDPTLLRAIDQMCRRIGTTLAGVVAVLAPDVIVLGGGLIEAMPGLFLPPIEAAIRARVMPVYVDKFRVAAAELGDDATTLGAAAWAERMTRG